MSVHQLFKTNTAIIYRYETSFCRQALNVELLHMDHVIILVLTELDDGKVSRGIFSQWKKTLEQAEWMVGDKLASDKVFISFFDNILQITILFQVHRNHIKCRCYKTLEMFSTETHV